MFKHVFKRFVVECRGDFGSTGPFWPFLLVILDVRGSKYVKMDPRGLVARDVTLQSCSKCLKTMFKQVFKRFRVESNANFGPVKLFLSIFTATSKIFGKKPWKIGARGHTMRDETLESGSKCLKVKVIGGFVPKFFFDRPTFWRYDIENSKIWRFSKFSKKFEGPPSPVGSELAGQKLW